MTPANDVDLDITLDSINPPVSNGRTLRWSGERVPEPGERVICVPEEYGGKPEFQDVGMVVGYFQAHGWLGLKVRLDLSWENVFVFGSQILANPEQPKGGATQ